MSSLLRLKYVQKWIDRRNDQPRYYFRRPGFKRVPLPGSPWSPEFMTAYAEAMAGQPAPVTGRREFLPGTMNALAVSYFNSISFRSLKPSTQAFYRTIIDRFCREEGHKRVATLKRKNVVERMAERADKPDSANGLRKVLRAMMKHAIEIGLRQDDPTRDVRAIRVKSDGFHSWTEDEIAQFETCHGIGSRARLAFALLLYTGQRRSYVIRMGPQHIRDGLLRVKQIKTGAELSIPVAPQLQEIIAASSIGQMIFLMTQYDKPFSGDGFGHWFRAECTKAGLPHCSAHGLRKACARRLADAGCSQHEIAAITGHASLHEVVRYTKGADQKRLATMAMQKLTKREQEVSTPTDPLTKMG
jgi:integrase